MRGAKCVWAWPLPPRSSWGKTRTTYERSRLCGFNRWNETYFFCLLLLLLFAFQWSFRFRSSMLFRFLLLAVCGLHVSPIALIRTRARQDSICFDSQGSFYKEKRQVASAQLCVKFSLVVQIVEESPGCVPEIHHWRRRGSFGQFGFHQPELLERETATERERRQKTQTRVLLRTISLCHHFSFFSPAC